MNLILGLLVLLAACVIVGIFRKIAGGTFFPKATHDGAHAQDRTGKWWRYNEDTNSIEEAFRRKKRSE